MVRPGPKPIDVEDLKVEAQQWATVLFCLLYGQAGMIQKIEWGPWRGFRATKPSEEMLDLMKGAPWGEAQLLKTNKKRQRTGTTLVAKIVPADAKSTKLASKALNKLGRGFDYIPPKLPLLHVWHQLETAASLTKMRRALRFIEKYLNRNWSAWSGREYPRALDRHAGALLAAKRLISYPKSKRRRSDDKRVVFFAKVLAGLELGRSPLYTTKKLSHWRPPKDLGTNPYQEFVASFRSQRAVSADAAATFGARKYLLKVQLRQKGSNDNGPL